MASIVLEFGGMLYGYGWSTRIYAESEGRCRVERRASLLNGACAVHDPVPDETICG
ncbi:MAG: hypothetical protein GX495_02200 [Chloroflexi bacterium]|nr:hypothetical protein [Chloroflexota bacterium]